MSTGPGTTRSSLTCDADVDGAHIRTLILTFLFRHMKELIEAGYVYIAQPPLYRLKVGNDERYFEKEHQLEDWLVRERLDKIEITDRNGQTIKLSESRLQRLQRAVKEYEGWGSKLKETYGNEVVGFVKDNRMIEREINDVTALEKYFREQVHEDELHRVEIAEVTSDSVVVKVSEKSTGAARTSIFPLALFQSHGYRSLQATHRRLIEITGEPAFTFRMNKLSESVQTFEDFRPTLLSLAQEGLNLQRFKGLGEMNPEQLWETTLNPENRILQQVSVEDAAAADEIFSMLMGDAVEPRRNFIERNARDVKFLDI